MEPAELRVEPLAENLTAADDHRADQRVGTNPPPAALGERKSLLQEAVIGG